MDRMVSGQRRPIQSMATTTRVSRLTRRPLSRWRALRSLGARGAGNADVAVDVVPRHACTPELDLLGRLVHYRDDSLLELLAGADVAVNLCHAGSMCLWNSSRNWEVFRK